MLDEQEIGGELDSSAQRTRSNSCLVLCMSCEPSQTQQPAAATHQCHTLKMQCAAAPSAGGRQACIAAKLVCLP